MLGGQVAIGENNIAVQATFGKIFNVGSDFQLDGSQFDRLFKDEDQFNIGAMSARVLYTPGHTPACVSYLIDDCVFVGDTTGYHPIENLIPY